MENENKSIRLRPQNIKVVAIMAVVAFIVLLASQLNFFSSTRTAANITIAVNRLLLAYAVYSWGRYLRNFTPPAISMCAYISVAVLLAYTLVDLIMNFRELENGIFETVFYPVVETVLAIGFFIIGFGALRAKDPIGGLKTIGCILLAKSLVSLFVVALLIILASVGGGSDEAGESVAWMWSISHSVIFAIDLLFYFATYKIFGTIADKIRI